MEKNKSWRDSLPGWLHTWLYQKKLDLVGVWRRCIYAMLVRKAKVAIRHRPLRILFLVNEGAKWKTQTLYESFKADKNYEPSVKFTKFDVDQELSDEDVFKRFKQNVDFFKTLGIELSSAYDFVSHKRIDLKTFNPDIVFYQQPWMVLSPHHPYMVSKFALTAYVPYYVPNYGKVEIDCQDSFHAWLWRYFVLNQWWCDVFRRYVPRFRFLPKFIPSGHTMLDSYKDGFCQECDSNGYVIYAPHWSFNHPNHMNFENYSTFLKSGVAMLEYAIKHPDVRWLFKPHPTLRHELKSSGVMTEDAINSYYQAWERLGTVCYAGNYVRFFEKSRAMITDSASFLVEYACTGRPIIHLISSDRKIEPMEPSRRLFSTYYQAHNLGDMYKLLALVVERNQDPKKLERIAAVRSANLVGVDASKNIIQHLNEVFDV